MRTATHDWRADECAALRVLLGEERAARDREITEHDRKVAERDREIAKLRLRLTELQLRLEALTAKGVVSGN